MMNDLPFKESDWSSFTSLVEACNAWNEAEEMGQVRQTGRVPGDEALWGPTDFFLDAFDSL